MVRYALVIGISEYRSLRRLPNPVNDAEAVARLLELHGEFQEVSRWPRRWLESEQRYEVAAKELTYAKLVEEIETFLFEQAVKKDALIYFAGHGLRGGSSPSARIPPKGFLAASDSIKDGGKAFPLEDFNRLIRASDLSSLVVLLDCCHAGSAIELALEQSMLAPSLGAFNDRRDYYLITACRSGEEAFDEGEHGIFTGALLRGLAPEQADEDGQVSVDRLFDFISREVRGKGQEPFRMGVGRSIPLVRYGQRESREVPINETCPYQGLRYFTEREANFFFGRRQVTETIKQKLGQGAFVPVIGASGSGKSSVIRAGLIPWLKEEGNWQVLDPIVPSIDPLTRFKHAFDSCFAPDELQQVYDSIEHGALGAVISQLRSRILLVVDQFEELFTLCPKGQEEQRDRFIQVLTQVTEIRTSPLAVVMAMRADFLDACLKYQSLTQLIQQQAVYLPPLTEDNLTELVVKPAQMQGYSLGEGLLDLILEDVRKEQECLPLLEFTLTELWQPATEQKHRLTLAQYLELGRVSGALNRRAEEIYTEIGHKFGDRGLEWVKRICLSLVRTGVEMKDTRQRQPKAEILALAGDKPEDQQAMEQVLERLIKGRLLVSGGKKSVQELANSTESVSQEAWVDLSHEAIIEGWQQFAKWREENRDLLRIVDRVKDAYREWLSHPQQKREKYLMMGGLLTEVQENWQKLEPYLPLVREFYQQSYAREQKQNYALRLLAEDALRPQADKVRQLLPVQPVDGLVLAIQLTGLSLEKFSGTVPSFIVDVLRRAVEVAREQNVFESNDGVVYSAAFSPNNLQIVSGGENGTVQLWNRQGKSIVKIDQAHEGPVMSVAFSPDGQRIVSASGDGTVGLWDRQGRQIGEPFQGHEDAVWSVAFSPDSQYIVSASADATVQKWNQQGEPIGQFIPGSKSLVYALAFDGMGQHLVGGSGDGTIELWNLQDYTIVKSFQCHRDAILSVAISSDGQFIASGSWDKTVRLWDLEGNLIGNFQGHEDAVTSVAISPNGQYIASGSWDKTVRLWDLKGNPLGEPCRGHQASVNSVNFSSDSQYLVSGSRDGTVRLWDVRGSLVLVPSENYGNWEEWLKWACLRLRSHPVFVNPATEIVRAACITCHKYLRIRIDSYCSSCGAVVPAESKFCIRCGYNLQLGRLVHKI